MADTSSGRSENRNPYLELRIVRAVDLHERFGRNLLLPSVCVSQNNKSWDTEVARESHEGFVWGRTLELELDFLQSFRIDLLDRSAFEQPVLLSSFIVPPLFIESLTEEPHSFWLMIPQTDISVFSPAILGSDNERGPKLLIQARKVDPGDSQQCSVKAGRHRNMVDSKDPHTLYDFIVSRKDGATWKVELRYSQVYRVRAELIGIVPGLHVQPFPPKTWWDWLSFICYKSSKFDPQRIQTRKVLIEAFFNYLLEHQEHFTSEALNSLLKMPND